MYPPYENSFLPLLSWCAVMCPQWLSHVQLCNPMDCSPPGSSVHGISQARTLEWAAISSSRGSSPSRDRTCVSCVSWIGRQILHPWATWCSTLFLPILGPWSQRLCCGQSCAAEGAHPLTRYVASANGCGGNIHTMISKSWQEMCKSASMITRRSRPEHTTLHLFPCRVGKGYLSMGFLQRLNHEENARYSTPLDVE